MKPFEKFIVSISSSFLSFLKKFSILGFISWLFKKENVVFSQEELFSLVWEIFVDDSLCSIVFVSILLSWISYLFFPQLIINFCFFNNIGILLFKILWNSFIFVNSIKAYPFDLFVNLSFIIVTFTIEEYLSWKNNFNSSSVIDLSKFPTYNYK